MCSHFGFALSMRAILGILLFVGGVAWAAYRIDDAPSHVEVTLVHFEWVRTIDGWERPERWMISRVEPPAVHPTVIAAGQVLVSMFALVASTGPAVRKPLVQTPA
jgi:hypothetical protein